MKYNFSVLITKEEDWYVARCAEINVTSQGKTLEEAKANLKEAIELYLESFGTDDLPHYVTEPVWMPMEVNVDA